MHLRAYEMVETTTADEIGLMKQQRRIEEAQRLRRLKQAASSPGAAKPKPAPRVRQALRRP